MENRAKHVYLHRFSCGGFHKIEAMIKKKRKHNEQELWDPSLNLDRIPYPLSYHEKWKRARQRPGGEFTSEPTWVVAEKIVNRLFFQDY